MAAVDPKLIDVFRQLALGQRPWPLYLHGMVGAGKTRASLALCDFVDDPAFYIIEDLLDAQMGGAETKTALWERVRKKDLIVVDEVGERESVGDLYSTTLKRVLDERENHAGRIGIYVSNIPPARLTELFDDRIVSRLIAGTMFHLDAEDRRVEK